MRASLPSRAKSLPSHERAIAFRRRLHTKQQAEPVPAAKAHSAPSYLFVMKRRSRSDNGEETAEGERRSAAIVLLVWLLYITGSLGVVGVMLYLAAHRLR